MTRTPRALAALLCLSLASASAATVARAAPAPPPPSLADSLRGEAKEAYDAGKRLFGIADYAGAAVKFLHAYELTKDVRLLWNVAACERAMHHYAKTYNVLAEYVRLGAGVLSPEKLAEAEESRAALKEFYSLVRAAIAPPSARVLVDGVEVGTSPVSAPFAVDLGLRLVRVEASGYEPFEMKLDVPGNTVIDLEVRLKSLPVPAGMGRLRISAGEGDAIAIDGKVVGLSRHEAALAPGEHSVRITAQDRKPYESKVSIAPGALSTLDVTLEKAPIVAKGGVPTWAWIVGGAVVVGGLGAVGYYAFKPRDDGPTPLTGQLGTFTLKGFRAGGF